MKLKKFYSSREVAALTGLSARQLHWWDAKRVIKSTVPTRRTEAGGYTERRYTSIELLELMVLADLRRRGFSIGRIRQLIDVLRTRFKVRLFEAIEGGGPITLYIDGDQIFARTEAGDIYNVLDDPLQPMLMLGEDLKLRQLVARESKRPRKRSIRNIS
ncbi:MAG TPA: MerR family transcriptional regulator [Vicinamibacterales bacterium]|nr:MerR family transcriptional regulator [Vicinamibacterales bacterium]